MAITTLDGYIAAGKQQVVFNKTASITTIAAAWFSGIHLAGEPGAGVLAGTSTTTGVVPTDATAGCPPISFSTGTGYLTNVDFGSTVACRIRLYDLLWKAGAYAFNASTTGQTPTSYAARVPGSDYKGLEIWVEFVTASTGVQNVNISYNNQDGVAKTTGVVALVAGTIGRLIQVPLAAGDTGVQGITGVVGSVATAGTFNVLVLRPLWTGRVRINNDGDTHGLDKTGMPQVYTDSALYVAVAADGTARGLPEMYIEIANG